MRIRDQIQLSTSLKYFNTSTLILTQHKLKIKRLKSVYLPSVQMDKDFIGKVRENPEKYLEEIT